MRVTHISSLFEVFSIFIPSLQVLDILAQIIEMTKLFVLQILMRKNQFQVFEGTLS